jgi:hypothetical protein
MSEADSGVPWLLQVFIWQCLSSNYPIISLNNIPARLLVPGTHDQVETRPPRSRVQTALPLHQLSWENIQRLCVRLLSKRPGVLHCQEYGLPEKLRMALICTRDWVAPTKWKYGNARSGTKL